MKKVKVAAVQFDVVSGEKERNLSKVIELLEKAAKEGVEIAAIPKDFLSGHPITKEAVAKFSEPIPGPATDRLAEVARNNSMYIVGGSIIEKENEKYYNTCAILDPKGELVGKYRKCNLWMIPPLDEVGAGLTPGTDYPVFETDVGKIGVLLDVDIDFPEPARILALKGAEIIFWLTAVDYKWIDICRSLEEAYAFVNMVYMVVANRCGVRYFGESRIISPMGETIASAGTSYGTLFPENIVIATLDLEELRKLREQPWNLLKRRKPETYELICKA